MPGSSPGRSWKRPGVARSVPSEKRSWAHDRRRLFLFSADLRVVRTRSKPAVRHVHRCPTASAHGVPAARGPPRTGAGRAGVWSTRAPRPGCPVRSRRLPEEAYNDLLGVCADRATRRWNGRWPGSSGAGGIPSPTSSPRGWDSPCGAYRGRVRASTDSLGAAAYQGGCEGRAQVRAGAASRRTSSLEQRRRGAAGMRGVRPSFFDVYRVWDGHAG